MTFQSAIQSWHAFYSIAGQGAAALAGLLFVGLALHLRLVVSRPDVRSLARVTLSSFGAILVLALFMTTPGQDAASTGWDIIGVGAVAVILIAPSLISGLRSRQHTFNVWVLLLRFGLIALGFVGIIIGGTLMVAGDFRAALDWANSATIVVLVIGLRNSWDVLVTVGVATTSEADVWHRDPHAQTRRPERPTAPPGMET
jgi:hypothetical protein